MSPSPRLGGNLAVRGPPLGLLNNTVPLILNLSTPTILMESLFRVFWDSPEDSLIRMQLSDRQTMSINSK